MGAEELVVLQHQFTEQTLVVPLARYRREARARYRHWRVKGQASFLAPPLFNSFSQDITHGESVCQNYNCKCVVC